MWGKNRARVSNPAHLSDEGGLEGSYPADCWPSASPRAASSDKQLSQPSD